MTFLSPVEALDSATDVLAAVSFVVTVVVTIFALL